MKNTDPNFENEISEINLEKKRRARKKDIKNPKKDLFYSALSVHYYNSNIIYNNNNKRIS